MNMTDTLASRGIGRKRAWRGERSIRKPGPRPLATQEAWPMEPTGTLAERAEPVRRADPIGSGTPAAERYMLWERAQVETYGRDTWTDPNARYWLTHPRPRFK